MLSILGGVAILGTGFAAYSEERQPTIEIRSIPLSYGQKITEEQIKKQLKNQEIKRVVILNGEVNSEEFGVYPLTLELTTNQDNRFNKKIYVEVLDQKAPEIITNEKTIEAGSDFQFIDYVTVLDNVDGDLTSMMKFKNINTKKVGRQSLTVEANDYSGNKAKKKIDFIIQDTTKPTIDTVDKKLTVGDGFDPMLNVLATDTVDGNITQRITVDGRVDTKRVGTYSLIYDVVDKSGNKTEKVRKIIVVAPLVVETNPIVKLVEPSNIAVSDEKPPVVTEGSTTSPSTQLPEHAPMTIYMAGATISYQNGGQGNGQAIIDSNPVASTWGGASIQSGTDGLNTHLIGHSPGVFSTLFNLGIGSQVTITDGNGVPTVYTVNRIFEVDDYAIGVRDQVNYWERMIGTGGGERVTFQTCEDDAINWVYEAVS